MPTPQVAYNPSAWPTAVFARLYTLIAQCFKNHVAKLFGCNPITRPWWEMMPCKPEFERSVLPVRQPSFTQIFSAQHTAPYCIGYFLCHAEVGGIYTNGLQYITYGSRCLVPTPTAWRARHDRSRGMLFMVTVRMGWAKASTLQ
jgi:hypothetical protein